MVKPTTLPAAVRAASAAYSDALAVKDGQTELSWTQLHQRVREVAAFYIDADLQVGDVVGIWAPNSAEWVVAALAVSYAGGVLLPLNSRYTAHEVGELLARTKAHSVVVADGFLGRSQIAELRAIDAEITITDLASLADINPTAAALEQAEARADAVQPTAIADILFTSGTTGRPKGAMSRHEQTIGVAASWGEVGELSAIDRYLIVNPFFHSFGYKAGIVVCLLSGATMYPMAVFDIDAVMSMIQTEQITVLPGAPTIFSTLLDAPTRPTYDLSSLRLAVTGAAVVPVVLIERMQSELGIDTVLTAFGMTEAVVVTMCRPGDAAELIANTCGRAIPGMATRIGEGGELLVKGDFVMAGYLDDPEATAEAIKDGWLHTGDVGVLDDQGNLKITDRLKDMYICGGFNVYPAEVEQTLARLDGVLDCAVVGIPDDRMGEVGKAFVVRRDDSLDAAHVREFLKVRLANYKIPSQVEFIDVLPRNAMGKVVKTDLREASH